MDAATIIVLVIGDNNGVVCPLVFHFLQKNACFVLTLVLKRWSVLVLYARWTAQYRYHLGYVAEHLRSYVVVLVELVCTYLLGTRRITV